MQWSLRSIFGLITVIALAIWSSRTFGVAVSVTFIMILCAAWFAFARIPAKRRTKSTFVAAVLLTTLAIYTGTFLTFRIFHTYEFPFVQPDDPKSNLVFFSVVPRDQQFARTLYYPLIKLVPGHCYYPNREEMEALIRSWEDYGSLSDLLDLL